jgi:hypothetical protein
VSTPDYADRPNRRARAGEVVADYLAGLAIFAGIVSLFYYPGRIGPAAIVIALIAAGMGTTVRRFAGIAMLVASLGWFFGMIVAVYLDRPLF